jgi:hypothetical protein
MNSNNDKSATGDHRQARTASEAVYAAAAEAGVDARTHDSDSKGGLYHLPHGVDARAEGFDRLETAKKEVRLARWLSSHRVDVVEALAVEQPVVVDSWVVTFWHRLSACRRGTPAEVAAVLRHLHSVQPPEDIPLRPLQPFSQLRERINDASALTPDDQAWLGSHLDDLQEKWDNGLPAGLEVSVVHGDPWMGNVAVSEDGIPRLLNLGRCSIGRPEWDLTSNAIKRTSTHGITPEEYSKFVGVYGFDVIQWEGYPLLRDIREFRMTCHLAQVAAEDAAYMSEAQLRVDCLRGRRGPRPWPWTDYVKS